MGRRSAILLCTLGLAIGGGGAAWAAFSGSTQNSGNSFSAAASFGSCTAINPSWLTGFEHGVASASGGGVLDYSTAATADSSVKRSGAYSLRLNSVPGTAAYAAKWVVGDRLVLRFALRFPTLPTADVTMLAGTYASAGKNLMLGYRTSDKKLTLSWSGTNVVAASAPVQAGSWYVIDLEAVINANPRTAQWRIDGVEQPSTSSSETAATHYLASLGTFITSDVFTAHYDDIAASSGASAYPLGDGRVKALSPDGVAAHNSPTRFVEQDGSAIDADTWNKLDDIPMSSTADVVAQISASGTSYLGFSFADTADTCIRAVSAVAAMRSSDTAANNGKTSIFDGSTERVVFSGDMSETTLLYKSAVINPASSPWTTEAVNGLVNRVGFSTDVTPYPVWDSLLLEYETAP